MRCLYGRNIYFCIVKQSILELLRLKEIRRSQKITIKRLSKLTGVHRDRISLIERGLVNPSFNTVVEIAKGINAIVRIETIRSEKL